MGVWSAVPSATRARKFSDSGEVGTFTIMSVIAQDVAVFSLFTSTSYWSDLGMSVSECAVAGSHRNMAHAATAFLTRPIIGIATSPVARDRRFLMRAACLSISSRIHQKRAPGRSRRPLEPSLEFWVLSLIGSLPAPAHPQTRRPDLIAIRSGSSLVGST